MDSPINQVNTIPCIIHYTKGFFSLQINVYFGEGLNSMLLHLLARGKNPGRKNNLTDMGKAARLL